MNQASASGDTFQRTVQLHSHFVAQIFHVRDDADTSALIRLKLASEYGYGSNTGTILTDKVNLLGSGAVPFWRWLEGSCRTPAGLGKIQANFEKFLVDGTTG